MFLLVAKNASCNLVTASFTRASSIANVKLILDAPCEINVTLMSLIVLRDSDLPTGMARLHEEFFESLGVGPRET